MTRRARAVGLAVLCAVLLAGCTTRTAGVGAPGGEELHLAQIATSRFDRPGPPLRVEQVSTPPTNADEWTVAAADPASRQLAISYSDGLCTAANHLAVQETATTVVIGITTTQSFQGACAGAAIFRSTTVELRKPLGGRALLEGATGVNDGLPKTADPAVLPEPNCSSGDGSASDVPVGMPDAATRIAPTDVTKAFVCRTWWPKGSAHDESTTITGDRLAALVRALDAGTTGLRAGAPDGACTRKDSRASWYAITLEGSGVQVEVKTDAIWCDTITNGAASGTMTPALVRRLDALFD